MKIKEGGGMDIQRKCFEESNNINPDWSFKFDEELQQYIALDSEMELQVDEFNEHWDTFRAGWEAKAQAVPEGFVLIKDDTKTVVAIERMVEQQVEASGMDSRRLERLDGWKIIEAAVKAQEPAND